MSGHAFDPLTGPFQRVQADLTTGTVGLCDDAAGGAGDVYPAGAVTAGPYHDCDSADSDCSGGVTSGTCRAMSTHNNRQDIVALAVRIRTRHFEPDHGRPTTIGRLYRAPRPALLHARYAVRSSCPTSLLWADGGSLFYVICIIAPCVCCPQPKPTPSS